MLDYYGSSQDGALNSFYTPDYHPLHPILRDPSIDGMYKTIIFHFKPYTRSLPNYKLHHP